MKDSCDASVSLPAILLAVLSEPYLLVNVQLPENLSRVKQMCVLVYPVVALACIRLRHVVLLT